jgi:hypothetical protein
MSRWTGPHAVRDARPEGDGGWGTLSAVGLSLMLSLWPGTLSFLHFGCFSFETL